ncbi:4'-phosphopantetheinyl transferase family protein [Thiocapsa bogorovii]|uniref:4'-phosphopantetheinyl transferase family protein n=1 Tax=Thiocapsa bogorovii TaxID=521689 RepID=UPI001E5758EB|nr:4'-phosphopantetheinyl transferase superfamily protein [Thiocapsa bogorovii]UHD14545.1 4'-phosphopantetheinyl transferase superfamily protein [Thiocapsa bogorovii]
MPPRRGDQQPKSPVAGTCAALPPSRFSRLVERPLPPLDDEVHLYTWDLDRRALQIEDDWMSHDERVRAERFRFERDRRRFRATRQTLRWILGSYCGCSPESIRFGYGRAGKPHLVGSELGFNLSHSGGRALLAVVSRGAVGVDLEEVRPIGGPLGIAEHFFSPIEVAELKRISLQSPSLLLQAFFQCWTRKEAYLKASGAGLSEEALRAFAVSCHPDETRRLLTDDSRLGAHSGWSFTDVVPHDGFVGAVAVSEECRRWSVWAFELDSQMGDFGP